MSLANGRTYTAIPGPSVLPDRVLRAMHQASPNIYAQDMSKLTEGLVRDLKRVAGTQHEAALYISNGHGAWEAALANTLLPGDKVLAPVVGTFGTGWAEMARARGLDVEIMEFDWLAPMDIARVQERLAADTAHEIKAILAVHVDTSTSLKTDPLKLRQALDAEGHPALLMNDCIASLGADRYEMDKFGVDVMITASQKGLMMAPGMAFVFFNERAEQARARVGQVSQYWDWRPRIRPDVVYRYYGGTPPTQALFGLREALDMIIEEGLSQVWARHTSLAQAIWAAVDAWAEKGPLCLNVASPEHRSSAVTSIHAGADVGPALRQWVEQNTGVTLGIGIGRAHSEDIPGESYFRIGHMGHVNAHMTLGVLAVIQSGLVALGVPHGSGALDAAAESVASSIQTANMHR